MNVSVGRIFTTSSSSSFSSGQAIIVNECESISIIYGDEFLADFEENESGKEFTFYLPIQGAGGPDAINSTLHHVTDLAGNNVGKASTGQQVMIGADISNNKAYPLDFVSIIEVRDSRDVTQLSTWQTGTVDSNGEASVNIYGLP